MRRLTGGLSTRGCFASREIDACELDRICIMCLSQFFKEPGIMLAQVCMNSGDVLR